tara:strand:- start:806 stop:1141 length:336 start_codon:yes stop_codon:yes gene_type:complete
VKLTKSKLKQIIKEELEKVLKENDEQPIINWSGETPEIVMPDGAILGVLDMHEELVRSGAVIDYEGEEINFATNEYVRNKEYPYDHPVALSEMYLLHKGYNPDDIATTRRS